MFYNGIEGSVNPVSLGGAPPSDGTGYRFLFPGKVVFVEYGILFSAKQLASHR